MDISKKFLAALFADFSVMRQLNLTLGMFLMPNFQIWQKNKRKAASYTKLLRVILFKLNSRKHIKLPLGENKICEQTRGLSKLTILQCLNIFKINTGPIRWWFFSRPSVNMEMNSRDSFWLIIGKSSTGQRNLYHNRAAIWEKGSSIYEQITAKSILLKQGA